MRRPRAQQLDKHKRNSRWSAATLCVCLVVLTWVVFGQTRRHEFVNYDDQEYVYQNKRITSGVSLENFCWAFTHAHSGNWHPLTTISHMLDCQFYGLKPAGHHLSNVVLHSVAVFLPFILCTSNPLPGSPNGRTCSAACFSCSRSLPTLTTSAHHQYGDTARWSLAMRSALCPSRCWLPSRSFSYSWITGHSVESEVGGQSSDISW